MQYSTAAAHCGRGYNSLYVHVPFCGGRKCDYCAFFSLPHPTAEQRKDYLVHLAAEFARSAGQCAPLRSIFVGGGTPSALDCHELSVLTAAIKEHFTLQEDCEWTFEANPESLTADKLEILLEAGVTRLSLGVQSFIPRLRAAIGRCGTLGRLPELVDFARRRGLPHLNLDLIYAIPGETAEEWRHDLQCALALSPDHLSCYSLILEDGTPLARRAPAPVTEELFLQCWHLTDSLLDGAGLRRYEISNFSRPGCQCRHNREIWHGQSYLGCGPAAVSFDGVDRCANPHDFDAWRSGLPGETDTLSPAARAREIFAFAFRTVEGWNWQELQAATGLTRTAVEAMSPVQQALAANLITVTAKSIAPTGRGLLCNDDLLELLL